MPCGVGSDGNSPGSARDGRSVTGGSRAFRRFPSGLAKSVEVRLRAPAALFEAALDHARFTTRTAGVYSQTRSLNPRTRDAFASSMSALPCF